MAEIICGCLCTVEGRDAFFEIFGRGIDSDRQVECLVDESLRCLMFAFEEGSPVSSLRLSPAAHADLIKHIDAIKPAHERVYLADLN